MAGNRSFSHRIISGSLWLSLLRIATRGLGLVRSIILARLLTPADFGIIGITMIVVATIDIVTQTGFDVKLIHDKAPSVNLINTAWTLQAIRGLLLFFVVFAIAPYMAQFFRLSSLDLILRIVACSLIVTGIRNIGTVFFQKELRFDQLFKYEITCSIIDLVFSIILAYVMRNAWALVWGGLAGNVARFVMSYVIHPYRPRISIDAGHLATILHFGKWITAAGIIYAVLIQVDTVAIGKLLGPEKVGFYQMAVTFSSIIGTDIPYLIRQITFPTYAMLQNNTHSLRKAYLEAVNIAAIITFPLGVIFLTLTDEIVGTFLGTKWQAITTCLRIFAISGIVGTLGRISFSVFLALGRPKYETVIQCGHLFIILVLIYPFTKEYGIEGTAIVLLLGQSVVCLSAYITVGKMLDCHPALPLKPLSYAMLNAVVMASCVLILKPLFAHLDFFWELLILMTMGGSVYLASAFLTERWSRHPMLFALVKEIRHSYKG